MELLAGLHMFLSLLFIALIVALALMDIRIKRLPDKLTFPLLCIGMLNAGLSGMHSLTASFFSALIAGGCFALIAMVLPGKLGWGDVKFVAAMGAYLSFPNILIAVFFASLAGSIVGGALLIKQKASFDQQVTFGPYLTFGALITLFWGDKILTYYWTVLLR